MVDRADLTRIREDAARRGITRLCHFTQSRSLSLIVNAGAILSTTQLQDRRLPHHPNDPDRLDQHRDHVSCTIQYPNARTLSSFQRRYAEVHDWAVILIRPSPLWRADTLFCRRNAATANGGLIRSGSDGFAEMFRAYPNRPYGWRAPHHLPSCPTADQAEVLVPRRMELDLVIGVVVPNRTQAERDRERLRATAGKGVRVHVCAEFFDAEALKHRRRNGPELDPTHGDD